MKFIVFALLIAAVAANPIFQSEDVGEEFVPKEEDWQMIPDTNGFLHLVDINSVEMDMEPAFNSDSDVIFHLFTRQNPTVPSNILLGNSAQLGNSHFLASRQCRFYTHGWGSANQNAGAPVRTAYLQLLDANVFIVNWSVGSDTANYILARQRVNLVGATIANFIIWINSLGTPYGNVVALGHSLGGHVAAAAAKRTPALIQAVIGLCPAGPLFSVDDPANRIHHTDAQYTEMMLTDSGRLGFVQPVCHNNFYMNWGINQPGCGTDLAGSCGHGRAIDLFAASLNHSNVFGGERCSGHAAIQNRSCPSAGPSARMGGDPVNNSGPFQVGSVFLVTTDATHPFAHGPR